jgi:hypothetical protein
MDRNGEERKRRKGTHVQIIGTADLGIPPPSSLILIVISSLPSTTTTLIGGKSSSLSTPNLSTTALSEFFSSSKQICDLSSASGCRKVKGGREKLTNDLGRRGMRHLLDIGVGWGDL